MSTALISRVERRSVFAEAETIAPGPGAYTDPRVIKPQLPAFAPFTSAKRTMDFNDTMSKDIPAPGSYELEINMSSPSVAAAASAFKSRVERFEPSSSMEKIIGPGPGTKIILDLFLIKIFI